MQSAGDISRGAKRKFREKVALENLIFISLNTDCQGRLHKPLVNVWRQIMELD